MFVPRPVLLWLLLFFVSENDSYAQLPNAITFQELDSLQKLEERPVIVFIHTDWCRYCQAMQHTTFQDETVLNLLNKSFHVVALNAEDKQDIAVKEQTFHFQPTGNDTGTHELAQALGQVEGKLTFPTLCYLNADYEIIYQQVGFLSARQLTETLEIIRQNEEM